jgi:hypothetical protein
MAEQFAKILLEGAHRNSLGRAAEVVDTVLQDKPRLEELYTCLFDDDPWVRMRAADSLEKVCREHPEWLEPYITRFEKELSGSTQPSIQWHLAQMYAQVSLTPTQKKFALQWLKSLIATVEVDWIVSANAMETLVQFTRDGSFPKSDMAKLLKIQQHHKSKAVVRRAGKFLAALADA